MDKAAFIAGAPQGGQAVGAHEAELPLGFRGKVLKDRVGGVAGASSARGRASDRLVVRPSGMNIVNLLVPAHLLLPGGGQSLPNRSRSRLRISPTCRP